MNSLNWEHMPFTRFALAGQDVRETFHVVCKHIFRRPILLHHFIVLFHGYCVFYKSFFLLFKARLLLQYQDHSWAQGALRKAMESAGGIMAGLHWSNIPTADRSNFFSPQDIFFLWGHSHRYLLSLGGVKERLSLYSGAWLTEVAESITECSSRLFVIVVFDSSTDELIHQTPQALRVFYGVIVDFLECNTGAMALFKPKNNAHNCIDVLQESDRVLSARFSTLESAGRVRWLPASTSPCDAARNSHLCVCFGINSAGVLSSLLGARSIHWDCAGFRRYFMYQHIGQRVVFHDLAEFKDALVRAMAGDDKVGDFSPFVGQLDSFHDSQGPYRIGWFFTQYFGYLQNKGDAREALCAAVADYTRIWPKALPEDK